MKESIEIDLKELLVVLLNNKLWIILVTLLGAAIAFGVTRFIIPPQYTSSISLYVNNATQDGQVASSLNINDINASQKLVNTYIVFLQDDEVLSQVADVLMQDYSQDWLQTVLAFTETNSGFAVNLDALRKTIKMSAINNTEVLKIETETKSPEISARICSLIADIAPSVLQRIVKAGSVEVIGEAKQAIYPSSPSIKVNCAVGLLVGGFLSSVWFLVRYFFDTTIKGEEDFKKRISLPILGEVPDFAVAQKGGYKYGG